MFDELIWSAGALAGILLEPPQKSEAETSNAGEAPALQILFWLDADCSREIGDVADLF